MHDPTEDENDSFMERHGAKVLGLAVVVFSLGAGYWFTHRPAEKPKPKINMVDIMPPMPPPPPPPPPPPKEEPPPPPEAKEQEFVKEDLTPPEPAPTPDPEPAAPGTNVQGDGPPDGFGLRAGGGGGLPGGAGIGGGARRSGSKFASYAGKVQNTVAEALRGNKSARSSVMSVQVKIWADDTGRVTRAKLVGSTGDGKLDATLRDEVLQGLQLPEPPPADMPMPINMRLSARKP